MASATVTVSVTGEFPTVVDLGGDPSFSGSVEVTARASAIEGMSAPEADVYVTRSSVVVAMPLPHDLIGVPLRLTAGETKVFAAHGTVVACDAVGGATLPAGSYELFATLTVTDDDGVAVTAVGGPWTLAVR